MPGVPLQMLCLCSHPRCSWSLGCHSSPRSTQLCATGLCLTPGLPQRADSSSPLRPENTVGTCSLRSSGAWSPELGPSPTPPQGHWTTHLLLERLLCVGGNAPSAPRSSAGRGAACPVPSPTGKLHTFFHQMWGLSCGPAGGLSPGPLQQLPPRTSLSMARGSCQEGGGQGPLQGWPLVRAHLSSWVPQGLSESKHVSPGAGSGLHVSFSCSQDTADRAAGGRPFISAKSSTSSFRKTAHLGQSPGPASEETREVAEGWVTAALGADTPNPPASPGKASWRAAPSAGEQPPPSQHRPQRPLTPCGSEKPLDSATLLHSARAGVSGTTRGLEDGSQGRGERGK